MKTHVFQRSVMICLIQTVLCQMKKNHLKDDICDILLGTFEGHLTWKDSTQRHGEWEPSSICTIPIKNHWRSKALRQFSGCRFRSRGSGRNVFSRFCNQYICPFSSYYPWNDKTVLSLARADAWTTACTAILLLIRQSWETRHII